MTNQPSHTDELVGYELIGFSESGLDLISRLGISEQSILVTSRFEEDGIRKKCADLRVPLIPKGLAGFIPIEIISNLDAVLIVNETLLHEAWKFRSEQSRKSILCFRNSREFFTVLPAISLKTPVYVDLRLDGESGFDVTKKLSEAGFAQVYIATGADCSRLNLNSAPFLVGILGKEPPWLRS